MTDLPFYQLLNTLVAQALDTRFATLFTRSALITLIALTTAKSANKDDFEKK